MFGGGLFVLFLFNFVDRDQLLLHTVFLPKEHRFPCQFILSLKFNLFNFKYWILKEINNLKVAPIHYFLFSQTLLAAFYRMGRELLLSLHYDCILHCGEQGQGNNGCKHDCRLDWLPVIVAAICDVVSKKVKNNLCCRFLAQLLLLLL